MSAGVRLNLDGTVEEYGTPEPPPVAASVPLSRLLVALRDLSFISQAEALAAARTGDIPASLRAALWAAVPQQAARDDIELFWAAMYEAERRSPFWAFVTGAGIATEAQLDDVFRYAGALA